MTKRDLLSIIIMTILCVGSVKAGFSYFKFGVFYQLIVSILIFLFMGRTLYKQSIWNIKELFPFLIVFLAEIPIQKVIGKNYYGMRSSINAFLIFSLMIAVLVIIINNKNAKLVWKIINITAVVSSWLILIQETFYLLGIRLDEISGLTYLFKGWKFQFYRPCGPFSEPSHFAELGLLSLFYYMLVERNLKKSILLLLALFISTSSLGILGGVLVVCMYLLSLGVLKDMKRYLRISVYIISIVGLVFLMFWVNSTDNLVVMRILRGGSSSVRISRSFELFNELDMEHKIIGIGVQNQELYLNANNIILPSDNIETTTNNREFAQTFGYILCCTGIIGAIAFWLPLIKSVMRRGIYLKMFLILFFVVCIACCIFARTMFLMYLICFFSLKEIDKKCTNYEMRE